jgi:hypothetical protein
MASLPVGGLYQHFKDVLKDLWLLWELMLVAEPIVVIAPDPGVCSEAVVSLVDIINPVSLKNFNFINTKKNPIFILYF